MKNKRFFASRLPYALSLFAVLVLGVVAVIDYFVFQGALTSSEPIWKKWVLFSGYFFLVAFDLFDMIFYLETRSFIHTLFFILRIILVSFMQNIDITHFSRVLLGILPYHAYMVFGLTISLLTSAVILYYFYSISAIIPTPKTIPALANVAFFQLTAIFAEREKRTTLRNQELMKDLIRSNVELRTYIDDLSRLSIMEERVQLSNDLHDSIGHYLVAINIQLEKALAYRSISSEIVDEAIMNAKYSVEQALREVRRFVDNLHDYEDVYSLKEKATELVNSYKNEFKNLNFTYEGNEFAYAKIIRRNLFYILQECLTNIQKHAHAENVSVEINFKAREVVLHIKDDGVGFKVNKNGNQAGHYGLASIRQRVEMFNGTLNIESNDNNKNKKKRGTTIEVQIPLRQENP